MLSDVQYNELLKCYADPVAVMGRHECGRDVLRLIFVDYVNIKDIVSCSLVNRKWKQLLSNDPEILFKLCMFLELKRNYFKISEIILKSCSNS